MADHISKLKNGMVLISTEVPAGLYNSLQLKAISNLCDGDIAMAKATEDQRIALFVKEGDVDQVASELKKVGLGIRHYGEGLHAPVSCIGELCPDAEQNSLAETMAITEMLSTIDWQNRPPFKMGINSCAQCRVPSHTLDISMIGGPDGYQMSIGGKNSQIPEFGSLVAEGIPGDKLPELVHKVLIYYLKNSELEETLHDMIMRAGISGFVDLLAPYSQDAPGLDDPFSQTDVPAAVPLGGAAEETADASGLAGIAAATMGSTEASADEEPDAELDGADEAAELESVDEAAELESVDEAAELESVDEAAELTAEAEPEALETSEDEAAANAAMAASLDGDDVGVDTSAEEAAADAAMAAAIDSDETEEEAVAGEEPSAIEEPSAGEEAVAGEEPSANEEPADDAEQLAESDLEDIDLSGLEEADEAAPEPVAEEASVEAAAEEDDLSLDEALAEEPIAEEAAAEEPAMEEAAAEEPEEELDLSGLEEADEAAPDPIAEEAAAEEAAAEPEEELDLSGLEEADEAAPEPVAEEAAEEDDLSLDEALAEEPVAEEAAAEEPEEELDLSGLDEADEAAPEPVAEEAPVEAAAEEDDISLDEALAEEPITEEATVEEVAEEPVAAVAEDEPLSAADIPEDPAEADLESSIEQSIDEEKTFLDQEEDDPNEQAREQIAAGAIEISESADNVVAFKPAASPSDGKLLTKICMPDATTVCIEFGDELKVELDMVELQDRESPVNLQGKVIAFEHRPGEITLSVDGFTVVVSLQEAA